VDWEIEILEISMDSISISISISMDSILGMRQR
jgi:hypothetical protein